MTATVLRSMRRLIVVVLLLCVGLIAVPGKAFAHDKFVGSSPKDKTTVRAVPQRVTIFFEEPPGQGFSGMTVAGPDGKNIGIGKAKIVGNTLTIATEKTVTRGLFTVNYHIISDDGHPVSGVVHFTVAGAVTPAAVPSPATAAKATAAGTDHGWIVILVVAVLILGAVNIAVSRLRTKRS